MEDMEREKAEERGERLEEVPEVQRNLFMKDGTPFNINQPRFKFTLDDQRFFIIELPARNKTVIKTLLNIQGIFFFLEV